MTDPRVSLPWLAAIVILFKETFNRTSEFSSAGANITLPALAFAVFVLLAGHQMRKQGHRPIAFHLRQLVSWISKPLFSLIVMLYLRDVLQLEISTMIIAAMAALGIMPLIEALRNRRETSIAGIIYAAIAIFLFGAGIKHAPTSPFAVSTVLGGTVSGIFSVLLFSVEKTRKSKALFQDKELFSRFEALVTDHDFQSALDISEDGLWEFNLEPDEMIISRPLQKWLGVESKVISQAADFWIGKVHPQDWRKLPEDWIPEDFHALRAKIRSLKDRSSTFEIRISDDKGNYKWIRVRYRVSADGSRTTLHGSFKDIDQEKRAEAHITRLSLYDVKTGLPNFASLRDHMTEIFTSGTEHSMLFINIDNFNLINDLHGFFVGDEILAKISRGLMRVLPEHAYLYRFGGDEFVILTDRVSESNALAKSIQTFFSDRFTFKEAQIRMTCSIGITSLPAPYATDIESALKCADIALGHAKNSGKNQHAVFGVPMIQAMEDRHNLIKALEKAHRDNEFEVYYQTMRALDDSSALRVEALLRWNWGGKPISPSKFIPLAEETGLIVPIGKMVFEQVCRDVAHTNAFGVDCRASVNVSAVQILHPSFIETLRSAIEAHCVNPSSLTIEITETSLIQDTQLVRESLLELKNIGLHISLDDFGTGYSSLSHLLNLPIDELKLDQTFIHGFYKDAKRQNVIRNIIELAHGASISVVAEGVESAEEYDLLKQYGCDICQGYYISRPVPIDQIIEASSRHLAQ